MLAVSAVRFQVTLPSHKLKQISNNLQPVLPQSHESIVNLVTWQSAQSSCECSELKKREQSKFEVSDGCGSSGQKTLLRRAGGDSCDSLRACSYNLSGVKRLTMAAKN